MSVQTLRVSGVVKWFDPSKGYGFIVQKEGPDVLVHISCLLRDGYTTILEGATIEGDAAVSPKGLMLLRVVTMDDTHAIAPRKRSAQKHQVAGPISDLVPAQVKWFNRLRGFGFLTMGPRTPDIFVHMETLREFGIVELRPDQRVLVRYGNGPDGRLMAAEVRMPHS